VTINPIKAGKLGLGPWNLSTNQAISIEADRRDALAVADEGIVAMIHFEDRYAMVIDNLMDMERHLFNWSLLDMLRPMAGFDDLFTHKREANRFFGNLLSAARQYIDQTHHHMKGYFAATELTSQTALSEQYDAHLSFRIMEALRNYVQHEDLGVHTVRVGGGWLDTDGKRVRRYTVSIGIDLDHLSDATKFKASTLAEMKALPAMPDLKEVIRVYVSALGTAHEKMRKALKPQTDMWIAAVEAAFTDVETAYPGKKQHRLAVFEQNEDGSRTKLADLNCETFARLKALQRSNQTTLNLGPAYASTEALTSIPKT
jgi:hypothetical protein